MKKEYTEEDMFEFAAFCSNEYIEDGIGATYEELLQVWKKSHQKIGKVEKEVVSLPVEDWIDEWVALWPVGVKSNGNYIKSDKRSCLKKMKDFVKNYEFNKDIILEATEAYLEEKAQVDFAYTRRAVFFIEKRNEGSDLATWCDVIQGRDDYIFNSYKGQIKTIKSDFI
jgi:hypothetical protein